MASWMTSVEGLQKVQILPRAQTSHQPRSNTRWREETPVSNRVEQVSRGCSAPRKVCDRCGPVRDHHPRMPEPRRGEPWTAARRWNTVSALPLSARQGRGHRGRRPDHADTGRTRERVSASSVSCREIADQYGGDPSGGVHRASPAPPGKARRPAGSLPPPTRGDDRDGGTSGNAQARRTGVRQSERRRGAMAATSSTANTPGNASGHRQPGETGARQAARPPRQGSTAVRGTWCSNGDAGRHRRTTAGQGHGTPSPLPVPLRLERIATQAREYPEMAFPRSPIMWTWRCGQTLSGASPRTAPLGWTG
jgi:hypothetical protein